MTAKRVGSAHREPPAIDPARLERVAREAAEQLVSAMTELGNLGQLLESYRPADVIQARIRSIGTTLARAHARAVSIADGATEALRGEGRS